MADKEKLVTGYANFLDVMGFSSIVAGENHAQRINDYLQALERNLNVKDQNIEYVVFSDSIVVTTLDDTDESLQRIARACSSLFGAFLKQEIPVRGAIAHGSYIRQKTESGTFVAGRAIIDAYRYEEIQDWCGIMLCPSVVRKVADLHAHCDLSASAGVELKDLVSRRMPYAAFIQEWGGADPS